MRLLAALVFAGALFADGPQGDPLPPGAVTRFGSDRLRHAGIHGDDSGFHFRPDGKAVASITNRTVRLWDLADGKRLWQFEADSDIHAVALASDSGRLAVCAQAGIVLVDVTTGKAERTIKVAGKTTATFSPDGGTLATALNDWGQTIELWDVA